MRLKSGQNLASGLMFMAVGLAAYIIGYDYPLGSAARPDTGVLPRILAWCLMGTGAILCVQSFTIVGEKLDLRNWAWRPVFFIGLASVTFALLIDQVGLIVTMVVSMTLAALGTPETRWREFLLFSLIMLFIGWGMFIWALGMPIKTWPDFAGRVFG